MSEYITKKISDFERYLDREMQILAGEDIGYAIGYDFLETLVRRVRVYVVNNAPRFVLSESLPADFLTKRAEARDAYLARVVDLLRHHAARHHSADGSFWEDVQTALLKLAMFAENLPTDA